MADKRLFRGWAHGQVRGWSCIYVTSGGVTGGETFCMAAAPDELSAGRDNGFPATVLA